MRDLLDLLVQVAALVVKECLAVGKQQLQVADLRASGIMSRIAQVGRSAPDFTLPNAAGRPVSLAGLRARGAVVLSFYRGRW